MAKLNGKEGHWYTSENGQHYFVENGQTPQEGWEATKGRKRISNGKYQTSEDGVNFMDTDKDSYDKFEADEAEFDNEQFTGDPFEDDNFEIEEGEFEEEEKGEVEQNGTLEEAQEKIKRYSKFATPKELMVALDQDKDFAMYPEEVKDKIREQLIETGVNNFKEAKELLGEEGIKERLSDFEKAVPESKKEFFSNLTKEPDARPNETRLHDLNDASADLDESNINSGKEKLDKLEGSFTKQEMLQEINYGDDFKEFSENEKEKLREYVNSKEHEKVFGIDEPKQENEKPNEPGMPKFHWEEPDDGSKQRHIVIDEGPHKGERYDDPDDFKNSKEGKQENKENEQKWSDEELDEAIDKHDLQNLTPEFKDALLKRLMERINKGK